MRKSITHRDPSRSAGVARAAGFTIVEVLVALVILSIGLLGIAKLVLYSAHSNDSAYLRSQATQLAYEILDNMRANPTAAGNFNYNTPLSAAATNPGFNCLATICPPANLALYDVYNWKSRLAAGATGGMLPSGEGQVTVTGTAPVMATIVVQWDDAAAQSIFATGIPVGTAAPMSITLETALHP